jgi:large subunit ribosomal protein L6
MSRIGKQPIPLPKGVEVQVDGNRVKVKGPKGELTHELPDAIQLQRENGTLHVVRASDERFARAQHGLQRTLIANMVKGVSEGFEKTIELVGVGYRARWRARRSCCRSATRTLCASSRSEASRFRWSKTPKRARR